MKRNKIFDIIKGILILFMVMGHTQFFGHDFIFLFHMGCFFIVSGYFYNPDSIKDFNDIKNFVLKKVKGLYIPFVIWNLIFIILNNFLFKINITSNYFDIVTLLKKVILSFLFYGRTELSDSTWFLQTLFWISIIYLFLSFFLRNSKKIYLTFISFLFLVIGYLMSRNDFNFYQIGTILSSFCLYHLGCKMRKIQFNKIKKVTFLILIIISAILLLLIDYCLDDYVIRVMQNQIYNPIIFVISSILGFCFVYCLSYYVNNVKYINDFFSFLGKNTLPILSLHILSFKIVTYFGILYYKDNISNLSKVPIYRSNLWFFYTIAGIFIPIIYIYLKKLFVSHKKNKLTNKVIIDFDSNLENKINLVSQNIERENFNSCNINNLLSNMKMYNFKFDNYDYLINGRYPKVLSENIEFMKYAIDRDINNLSFIDINIDEDKLHQIINYAFRKVYYLQKKGYNITFDLKGIFKNSDIIYYNYFQECLKYINK